MFVDGSKFRANASINNTWDEERCKKRLEIAEKNIERIMEEAEQIDKEEESQKLYKLRKEKAELPFGHMKRNLGAGQFLLRGKEGVNAELSILSTCFNIARMITIIGIPTLIAKLNSM